MTAPDYEHLAQRAAEAALDEYLHPGNPDIEDGDEECDCECLTCIVREVLTAAWPYLRDLALTEPNTEGKKETP